MTSGVSAARVVKSTVSLFCFAKPSASISTITLFSLKNSFLLYFSDVTSYNQFSLNLYTKWPLKGSVMKQNLFYKDLLMVLFFSCFSSSFFFWTGFRRTVRHSGGWLTEWWNLTKCYPTGGSKNLNLNFFFKFLNSNLFQWF